MKRVFAALSAVLVMLSVTACGDKESESSSSKRSSAESLSGTYRIADIDGFGDSESGSIKRLIEFSDDGRFEMFLYNDDLSDKEYYKEYGCICNETGSYDVSDGEISLTFDPINTKEELIEQYPSCLDNRYRETGDTEGEEEYYENIIKNVMEGRKTDKDLKYSIADDYDSFYQIDDPHRFRKGAYQSWARQIWQPGIIASEILINLAVDDEKFTFISSEGELNGNFDPESRERLIEVFKDSTASWDGGGYTAEEGFTTNPDLSKHSWLLVMKGDVFCTLVMGENIDSDIFQNHDYYCYPDETHTELLYVDKEISDNFHSIRDVYNYYKSLD